MADEILSREEWIRVMEKRLESKDFEVLSYKLNPHNSTGGFLGDHSTADITVRLHKPRKCEKVFHFFVKAEPKVEPGKESVTELFKAYKKEGGHLGVPLR
ncbi:hypothetical protein R5R35_002812 [Gryllus longicercus]|uniref:Uncharacterized protein n=1 Tax=Gryllus longicercus TaxID=2509291 RepID=A0AAN9VWB5_9ORTH